MVRHNYSQQFKPKYQNLTKYSLIEDLGIEKLTNKEIENLPDHLPALPTLRFNELKRRLVEIKKHRVGITFHKQWARTTTQKGFLAYGRTECNSANGARNCKRHGLGELQNQMLQEVLAESCHRC